MKGKIAEVFYSIQCEGLYLGERQIFVRFFGCNLNCKFCDTKLERYKEYLPQELLEKLKLYKNRYHSVSFTGGEPLLQKNFLREISKLTHKNGFKNYLETNGTLPGDLEEVIDFVDIVAMDLKLPSSTGLDSFWGAHRKFLEIASRKDFFLKAVICLSTKVKDLEEALNLIKEVDKYAVLVLQPNSFENDGQLQKKLETFKDVCVKSSITTCIIPQMQRTLWVR